MLARTTTYTVLLFMILGVYFLIRRKEYFIMIFLLAWGSVFFYYANNPIFAPRWLSIILPPMFILGAYGLDLIYHKKKKALKLIAVIFVIYILVTMFMTIQPIIKARHDEPLPKKFSLTWEDQSPDNSVIVFPPDLCVFPEYYTGRECFGNDNFTQTVRIIRTNLKKGNPVYVTLNHPSASEREGEVLDFATELIKRYNASQIIRVDFEDFHKSSINALVIKLKLLEINPNHVPEDSEEYKYVQKE
jgi:hypothetical protein